MRIKYAMKLQKKRNEKNNTDKMKHCFVLPSRSRIAYQEIFLKLLKTRQVYHPRSSAETSLTVNLYGNEMLYFSFDSIDFSSYPLYQ